MKELSLDQFERVLPLAKQMSCCNAVFSIIEGITKGKIWVDNLKTPAIIFLWDTEKRFYLIGDHLNSHQIKHLKKILEDKVIHYGIIHHFNQWTFHYRPREWEPILLELLANYLPLKDKRLYLTFEKNEATLPNDFQERIPPNLDLCSIDRKFFKKKSHLKHFEDISSEIRSWTSLNTFLALGYGFCLAKEKEIASWCIGEYFNPRLKQIDVGIETYPPYRQQGFAYIVGSAFIKKSLERNLTVGWDCWEDNIASKKTAEKLGFILKEKYPVLFGWYNKIDGLIIHAWNNITKIKNYKRAIKLYKQVLDLIKNEDPLVNSSYLLKHININLNLAGCYGQIGEYKRAFFFLQRAINDGIADPKKFKNGDFFKPLRNHPYWQKLIDGT